MSLVVRVGGDESDVAVLYRLRFRRELSAEIIVPIAGQEFQP
jgi:hypothetical protein